MTAGFYRHSADWVSGGNGPYRFSGRTAREQVMANLIRHGVQPNALEPMYYSFPSTAQRHDSLVVSYDGFQMRRVHDDLPVRPSWYTASAFDNGWDTHSTDWAGVRYDRTGTGLTVINGLIRGGTANTLLLTLPEQFSPLHKGLYLNVSNGPSGWATARVEIRPDGSVYLNGWNDNDYATVQAVFPNVEADLEWVPITTWNNGWGNYSVTSGDTTWPAASVAKDVYGRVWMRGMISGGTVPSGSDVQAFRMPSSEFYPEEQTHLGGLSSGTVFTTMDVRADGWVNVKAGAFSNSANWTSLCNMTYQTPNTWRRTTAPAFTNNGWSNYGSSYPSMRVANYPDGLRGFTGLIRSGNIGTSFTTLDTFDRVDGDGGRIFAVNSSNGLGRLDIRSDGAAIARFGSSLWFSLDGTWWLPGQ